MKIPRRTFLAGIAAVIAGAPFLKPKPAPSFTFTPHDPGEIRKIFLPALYGHAPKTTTMTNGWTIEWFESAGGSWRGMVYPHVPVTPTPLFLAWDRKLREAGRHGGVL